MVMHQTQQNNRRTTRSSATTTTTTTSTNNTFTTTTTDQQQEQQQTQQFDETTTNHDAFDRRQQQKDFDHQILSHAFPFLPMILPQCLISVTDVKVDPKESYYLQVPIHREESMFSIWILENSYIPSKWVIAVGVVII
ncbi:hypothetical protein FDP41_001406 [Naegleria fowleri]|uniref:Uncharacterized protein n=1 Tax=Naegleria fowleri TaxID=5763 RepID=A0A6A5BY37_NAEFO|nr:uncharacterized protein FDP41_001406 [Naegleria fowleri]KAF0979542.1 hypothetical protein FDP41_001406 [Naegleria fowleri]